MTTRESCVWFALALSIGINILLNNLHLRAIVPQATSLAPKSAKDGTLAEPFLAGNRSDPVSESTSKMPLQRLIERLKSLQIPEGVIRMVIEAEVEKSFAHQVDVKMYASARYWGESPGERVRKLSALKEIKKTKEALLASVFGEAYKKDPEIPPHERRYRFGDLNTEKVRAVRELQSTYADIERNALGQAATQNERIKIAGMTEQEFIKDLSKILTSDELSEYQLRQSKTASNLRSSIQGIPMEEEEYKKLFARQKEWDDQFYYLYGNPNVGFADFASSRERQAKLHANFFNILGEERFITYLQNTNGTFQSFANYFKSANVSPSVQIATWQAIEDADVQIDATLLRLPSDSDAGREISRIAQATKIQLQSILPPEHFREFLTLQVAKNLSNVDRLMERRARRL